jgi:hypothetical protein
MWGEWWWWALAFTWLLLFRRHRKLAKAGLLPDRRPLGSWVMHGEDDGPRWAPFRERGF